MMSIEGTGSLPFLYIPTAKNLQEYGERKIIALSVHFEIQCEALLENSGKLTATRKAEKGRRSQMTENCSLMPSCSSYSHPAALASGTLVGIAGNLHSGTHPSLHVIQPQQPRPWQTLAPRLSLGCGLPG